MSTSANFILPRNFLQWFVLFPSSHSKNFIGLIPLPVLGGQTLPERSENVKSLFSKRFLSTFFCSIFKSDSLSPRRRARSLTKLGRLQPTRSTWLWGGDSLLSLKGPLHAGYGRLMARLTTAADDDGCLQIYSPAACSFQHGVWEHACTLAYAAYLGGRWCKHAGMAALFKSGRVVWTVTLRLRSHRGLQRSCSASITTTAATAGPPKPDRLRQGELSDCALFADQCPLF